MASREEKILCEIWLQQTGRLTVQRAQALRQVLGCAQELYRALETPGGRSLLTAQELAPLRNRSLEQARLLLERCRQMGVETLLPEDPQYPPQLREIWGAPPLLYVRGLLPQWNRVPSVAIVGHRKAGPRSLALAQQYAHVLSAHGFVVVSGLAQGVDGAAHRGALLGPTPTVAVFGTPIDQCYPASHGPLLQEILQRGAAISEHPPGARGYPSYFVQRNRIISGLCLGTLVIEAPRQSGSLGTAAFALEQGRDVFALPGSPDLPEYAGSNALIRAGATLCCDPVQICQEYAGQFPQLLAALEQRENAAQSAPAKKAKPPVELDGPQGQLYELLAKRLHVDELCRLVDLPPNQVLTALTMLQIRGLVQELPGKYFEIV